jgi:hypothetical protein
MPDRDTVRFNDLLDDSSCMISHIMNSIDAPVAPVDQVGLLKDRRRPGRIHDVSPALIQLLRNPPGVPVVDDSVPMPEANEVASREQSPFFEYVGDMDLGFVGGRDVHSRDRLVCHGTRLMDRCGCGQPAIAALWTWPAHVKADAAGPSASFNAAGLRPRAWPSTICIP